MTRPAGVVLAVCVLVGGVAQDASGRASDALLTVEYLPQTEQLCGGAALAMVLRYWGDERVYPQDFQALVDRSAGGIRVSALADAAVSRGWSAVPLKTDSHPTDLARREVNQGRPIIALVQIAPNHFHYVVIVAVTATEVVYHDPAHGSFRVTSRTAFEHDWSAAGRWMLLVLPPAWGGSPSALPDAGRESAVVQSKTKTDTTTPERDACSALVDEAVRAAGGGARDDAEHALTVAMSLCPTSEAAWGEMAGLRFVEQRYREAASFAAEAVDRNDADDNAWQVLATSRYLTGDFKGALEAWNHFEQPRIAVVRISGAARTDEPVIARLLHLAPRQLLTPDAFLVATRRLFAMPSLSSAALTFRANPPGPADIQVTIQERPILPSRPIDVASIAGRVLFARELRFHIVDPSGSGGVVTPSVRWASGRPRADVMFDVPSPRPLPGFVHTELLWERQSYLTIGAMTPTRQERRRGTVQLTDWASGDLRWLAGGGVDRIDDHLFVTLTGRLSRHLADDRLALHGEIARWWSQASSASDFATSSVGIDWRSTAAPTAPVWTAVSSVEMASVSAPLAEWPIAGSSNSRGDLLRAHPLLRDGLIQPDLLGRRLLAASIEYSKPIVARSGGVLGVAGFADAARVWHREDGSSSPLQVDVGLGARIGSSEIGALRLDAAVTLRTGEMKFSAGYMTAWGAW